MNARVLFLAGLVSITMSGCALVKPKAATDPVYIAAYQKERAYWEKRAAQVFPRMTRWEVDRILPRDQSLKGISGVGTYVSAGKTRPEAHSEEWYYLSPHFICSIDYDFTGLQKEPAELLLARGEDPYPEFPSVFAPGSDPSQNRVLKVPAITLVEPKRVKNVRP
jgi:hypothetical protein